MTGLQLARFVGARVLIVEHGETVPPGAIRVRSCKGSHRPPDGAPPLEIA